MRLILNNMFSYDSRHFRCTQWQVGRSHEVDSIHCAICMVKSFWSLSTMTPEPITASGFKELLTDVTTVRCNIVHHLRRPYVNIMWLNMSRLLRQITALYFSRFLRCGCDVGFLRPADRLRPTLVVITTPSWTVVQARLSDPRALATKLALAPIDHLGIMGYWPEAKFSNWSSQTIRYMIQCVLTRATRS